MNIEKIVDVLLDEEVDNLLIQKIVDILSEKVKVDYTFNHESETISDSLPSCVKDLKSIKKNYITMLEKRLPNGEKVENPSRLIESMFLQTADDFSRLQYVIFNELYRLNQQKEPDVSSVLGSLLDKLGR